ncbi:TetR/AcrR family transcriptional regulator [Aridibaculum aurantiacum]|uniref:TetR/AcrR family transcriptional regulator n=1 Tax=Aridibaculum aurantiacum TaxID=2810307 RepID=UPI001F609E52|nr:TetR/AcrR family transcriptional regulator [Aridibaculum aurantiacum]
MKVEQHVSRKELIIEKAASLFKEKGFKATSMRDLAEALGIEAASLYNHISSKNELLHSICLQVAQRFFSKMEAVMASAEDPSGKLETILRFHIQEMVQRYDEVYVSDREWRHLSEPQLTDYKAMRRNYRQQFTMLIEAGIAAGRIKPIDAPTAVLILLHAISGIESWHRSKRKIDPQALEENMITILISGLKN